jgi:multiple sugar transport system ATP-binding protein
MIYVTHDQIEAMTMGDRIIVLKDGVIQQVAGPMTLYDSPVNKFVAGFIGSPAMNFVEAELREDGKMYLDEGTFKAEVPSPLVDKLKPYVDKKITFGVRPEAIGDKPAGGESGRVGFKAKVEVVEPMGNETIVYVTTGRTPIVARLITREEIEPESEVELFMDMRRAHFFDPENEATIV